MSWMAILVPSKLRDRYFSLRRSLSSLMALLTIPVGGWLVSQWMGGELEGYAIVLIIAVVMGLLSLGFQFYMTDVNPQNEKTSEEKVSEQLTVSATASETKAAEAKASEGKLGLLKDRNFLRAHSARRQAATSLRSQPLACLPSSQ